MSEDNKQDRRMTLGPEVSNFLATLPDGSAAALDIAFRSMLQIKDRAHFLEAQAVTNAGLISRLIELNTSLSSALSTTSDTVTHLTVMVDQRTREFEKLLLHISTMVGSHMTDGAERERLHQRFWEMAIEMRKQMESLSTVLKDQNRTRQQQVHNAVSRAEEERLAIAEQGNLRSKTQPERAGMER